MTWADYDSDGDIDLLVRGEWLGQGEIFGRSEVYVNNGGAFTLGSEPLPAPLMGNAGGAFTWFDVDSDGDLDYFVAGGYEVPGGNGLDPGPYSWSVRARQRVQRKRCRAGDVHGRNGRGAHRAGSEAPLAAGREPCAVWPFL